MQNNFFWAPNTHNQSYFHQVGIDHHQMSLIYPPSSQSYFFVPILSSEMTPQLFMPNVYGEFNSKIQQIATSQSHSDSTKFDQKLKIQTNQDCWINKKCETDLLLVKIQQNQQNQQSKHNQFLKTQEAKMTEFDHNKRVKAALSQQKSFYMKNEAQSHLVIQKVLEQKQMNEQTQSDGIEMIKDFSKELIVYILKNQDPKSEVLHSLKYEIAQLIHKKISKNKQAVHESLDQVTKILSTKFSKFKKTKEEMIKYIFRRIFNAKNKPEEVTEVNWRIAQKIHKKNSSTFKSMNMKFVEKQFQNPIFIQLFAIFLRTFQSNFQKENEERIDRLNFIVASAVITEDMGELKGYKKLPWNKNILKSIEKLFEDLKQIQKHTHYPQNLMDLMTAEYKDGYGGQSSLLKRRETLLQRINSNSSDF